MAIFDTVVPAGVAAAAQVSAGRRAKYVYRPAVVVRLTIRLEDFNNDDGQDAQQEGQPAKTRASAQAAALASARALQAVRRASGVQDLAADASLKLQQQRAAGKVSSDQGGGGPDDAAPLGASPDDDAVVLSVVPLAMTLQLNGFKTADRLEMTLNLADFPVVPDIVRSMFVEVFMGTVSADDATDPARWVPQLFNQAPSFRGYATEETVDSSDSDLRISVSALSLEQRLIDLKINPFTKERRVARGGEDLADYVRRLISTIPEFNGTLGGAIGVRYFPNVDPAKAPQIDPKSLKRALQTAASRNDAGGAVQPGPPPGIDPAADPGNGTPAGIGFPTPAPQADVSVWDLVTRAAQLCGMMAVYDPSLVAQEPDGTISPIGANNILLVPPQNLKETPQGGLTVPGGPIDGFERQITVGGSRLVSTQVRFLVWGRNIGSLKQVRKYGRALRPPRVRVRCHNPDGGAGSRVLEAVFPKTARATAVSAVGSGDPGAGRGHVPVEEEVVRIVREVRRQEDLERIAVALYHTVGRHELAVSIETDELSSYIDPTRPETHNENPDLLRLRPGVLARVMVADGANGVADPSQDLVVNGLSDLLARRSNPAFLRKALLEGPNAAAFAAAGQGQRLRDALAKIEDAYASAKLTDWFYVRDVEIRFTAEDGFAFTINLAGFQEARNLPANLSPADAAANDALKAQVSQKAPDARAAAVQARTDALLEQLAQRAVPGGGG